MEILNNIFLYFFAFIILLSIIVFVHEFGHYIVAIINKVKVETFSIGFGKEIIGWNDKRGTRWKISLLPFGGYVKMYGEDIFSKKKIPSQLKQYAFSNKKIYQRFLIVAAGPLANFIFAIICLAFLYTFIGKQITPPIINEVENNSPASKVDLRKDDQIIKIENKSIDDFRDIPTYLLIYQKKEFINFDIKRNNEIILKKIKPEFVEEVHYGQKRKIPKIGISSYDHIQKKYPFYQSVYLGTKSTYEICSLTLKGLYLLIIGKGSKEDIGGPIKIAQISGQFLEAGILSFINLIILLSISIGLINLFPIPMLDGGHLVMYTVEFLIGRPVNKNIQEKIYKFGFAVIITLAVFLTYNDIINLINF
tara:strand:+ start:2984 stop:4075 length:1092 start_codon:yes stop_codon:yes gene_type:complete